MASRKPIVVLAMQGATVEAFHGQDKPTLQGGGVYIRVKRRNAAPILLSYAVAHAIVDLYNEKSGYHHQTDCTDAQRLCHHPAAKPKCEQACAHGQPCSCDLWPGEEGYGCHCHGKAKEIREKGLGQANGCPSIDEIGRGD